MAGGVCAGEVVQQVRRGTLRVSSCPSPSSPARTRYFYSLSTSLSPPYPTASDIYCYPTRRFRLSQRNTQVERLCNLPGLRRTPRRKVRPSSFSPVEEVSLTFLSGPV